MTPCDLSEVPETILEAFAEICGQASDRIAIQMNVRKPLPPIQR